MTPTLSLIGAAHLERTAFDNGFDRELPYGGDSRARFACVGSPLVTGGGAAEFAVRGRRRGGES
jgi:hypothetical protein